MFRFRMILFGVLGLSALCCYSEGVVVRYQKEFLNDIEGDDVEYLACICGNGTLRNAFLNRQMSKAFLKDDMSYQTCEKEFHHDVCNLLALCRNCSLHLNQCFSHTDKVKRHCLKEVYVLRDGYFKFQDSMKIGKYSTKFGENRLKRNVKECGHPTNMKTADIACDKSPSRVNCTQLCIFGHTLKDGPVKRMQCHTRDNRWQPSGFSECQPFVDCTLNLVYPGSLDCYTATAKAAPLCYVRCDHYEDKEAVPRRAYECRLDGSWTRALPFCVHAGSGIAVVPKPPSVSEFPYIADE